jgi:hypothetical protein
VSDHDVMVRILVVIGPILWLIGLLAMNIFMGRMLGESRRLTREVEGWLDPGMAERGAKALEEIRANASLMREVEERLDAGMAERGAKAFEELPRQRLARTASAVRPSDGRMSPAGPPSCRCDRLDQRGVCSS